MICENIKKMVGAYFKASRLKYGCLLLIGSAILLAGGCKNTSDENGKKTTCSVLDQPLSEFRDKLLDIAFETASLIPLDPHVKDRSKTQELVVRTCLEMDQPVRAIRYAGQIQNWRRGDCFSEIAFHCLKKGDSGTVQSCMAEVQKELEKIEENLAADEIDWRRERINLKMERVSSWQKQHGLSGADSKKTVNPEFNHLEGGNGLTSDLFEKQAQVLDDLIATGGFDAMKKALFSYVELYIQFYDNPQCRLLIENKVKTSWEKLPVFTRIELLLKMSESALDHSESPEALRLVNEAQVFIDDYQWSPEKRITLTARLIPMRFRVGDVEKAQSDAEAMLRLFDDQGDKIVDIYRAGVLRELAEACQKIGETQTALVIYKKAIKEGVENPNSRPRAEDLTATCCSMALNAVELDTQLWAQIHQIQKGLGRPW